MGHTPLGAPGLYIQTLLPGSPAAADGRLALGDRILEVNGSSLAGVSYPRYPPPRPAPGEEPGCRLKAQQRALSLPVLEMSKCSAVPPPALPSLSHPDATAVPTQGLRCLGLQSGSGCPGSVILKLRPTQGAQGYCL